MPDRYPTVSHPDKTLLIFSQVFIPDPASVGQHIADVAIEMARRGHKVLVYAANRGYENPAIKYLPEEIMQAVHVRRLPFSSFGKESIFTRILGTAMFHLQCLVVGLSNRNVGGILFSTSPPLIGLTATFIGMLRRIPAAYWAMDLNPDQLIALGKISPHGLIAQVLEHANRFILHRAALTVALDRFMADRLKARVDIDDRLLVLPPWPHEDHLQIPQTGENPFRVKHGLLDKFVVMYSGNHSPSNPLDTILQAARQLQDDPDIRFLFVGGGLSKKDIQAFIKEHNLANVLCLPYQPFSELGHSLSAADVHVVSLGQEMVGIVHPCKIYGAMAVARPILYLGPRPSHVTDLLDEQDIGWHIAHGDVDAAVTTIRQAKSLSPQQRQEMGQRAAQLLWARLSQAVLCKRFCDRLEAALQL
jgi:glycosyltransferase involved in cell wall biosynthesis